MLYISFVLFKGPICALIMSLAHLLWSVIKPTMLACIPVREHALLCECVATVPVHVDTQVILSFNEQKKIRNHKNDDTHTLLKSSSYPYVIKFGVISRYYHNELAHVPVGEHALRIDRATATKSEKKSEISLFVFQGVFIIHVFVSHTCSTMMMGGKNQMYLCGRLNKNSPGSMSLAANTPWKTRPEINGWLEWILWGPLFCFSLHLKNILFTWWRRHESFSDMQRKAHE